MKYIDFQPLIGWTCKRQMYNKSLKRKLRVKGIRRFFFSRMGVNSSFDVRQVKMSLIIGSVIQKIISQRCMENQRVVTEAQRGLYSSPCCSVKPRCALCTFFCFTEIHRVVTEGLKVQYSSQWYLVEFYVTVYFKKTQRVWFWGINLQHLLMIYPLTSIWFYILITIATSKTSALFNE